jgi:hypothetical protein
MTRHQAGLLAPIVLFAAMAGPPARANEFWIENRTPKTLRAVVGYYAPKGTYETNAYPVDRNDRCDNQGEWVSEGWYVIEPGKSRKVYWGPREGIFLHIVQVDGAKKTLIVLPELPERKGEPYSILPHEDSWPFAVDRDHNGFRLCRSDSSGRYSLLYGDKPAVVYDEIPFNSFDSLYPKARRGDDDVESVGCSIEKGSREVRFGKGSHLLKLRQDENLRNLRSELKPRP